MSDEHSSGDAPSRVYGPKDWRPLTQASLPAVPGGSVMCAAIKEDGMPCGLRAMAGTPFCRSHGGTTLAVQEQARRRVDAVRSELFELLCDAAKEAAETYVTIMRTGKRDVDRLRAADRVLELLGFRDDVANVPGESSESDIDKQLKGLLVRATEERITRVIEVTSRDDASAA